MLLLLLAICLTAMPAVLANGNGEIPGLNEFIDVTLKMLIQAILTGVCTSVLGYLKHTTPEDFSYVKLASSIAIGLIIGVVMLQFGWDYSTAEQWMAATGISIWVYWIIKTILVKAGVIKEAAT